MVFPLLCVPNMIDSRWVWVRRYAIAFVLVLVLTTLFGHSQIFANAPLAPRGLTAAHLVSFIGYTAALLLLWLAASRAASMLHDDRGWESVGREALVPVATLVVFIMGYGVPLILLRPFVNDTAMAVYNWLFVLAIGGAAIWFALAVYRSADALAPIFGRLARYSREAAAARHEEAPPPVTKRHCTRCGRELTDEDDVCRSCVAA
jgi:hypothetical protein